MKILLVEDDRDLCNTVKLQLERAGYETDVCYQGQDALFYANQYPYDVIVLDRMLPQVDGLTILQGLRRKQIATPVIITTALDGVNDRIDGLDAGADDYLVKPFAFEELLARLRVLLRKPVTEKSSILNVADLSLHVDTRRVFRGNRELQLSSKEYSLLHYMMQNAGVVLSRDKLEQHVWDYDFSGGSNVIDVYIRFLRKKVDEGYDKKLIHTVRGHGYVLKDDTL